MIIFDNVTLVKNNHTILANVSLELKEARIGIIGPNGAGKTSLLHLINGIEIPTKGQVTIDGIDSRKLLANYISKVKLLLQRPEYQLIHLQVAEDIAYSISHEPEDILRNKIQKIAKALAIDDKLEQQIHNLSGGEQQLVALAGLLITEPDYLLLDEPSSMLDLNNRRRLNEIISTIQPKVIVSTHDYDTVKDFARLLLVENGQITMDATPATTWDYYTSTTC